MPLLLYCVAKRDDVPVGGEFHGVAGSAVYQEQFGPVKVYFSREEDSGKWLKQELRTSAIEFNNLLKRLFQHAAIIPFRYPTMFAGEEELTKQLHARAAEYAGLLEKFRDLVQMDIRVTDAGPHAGGESGAEHLKRRRDTMHAVNDFCHELESALIGLSKGWRERPSKDGLRAFVMIARDRVTDLQNVLRQVSIPADLKVRVSGPWPVSEFIDQS